MTLREFIESEIKKRDMSLSEFARFIGISPSAVIKYLNEESRGISIEFMVKLARGTNTNLKTIVAMEYPEETEELDPSVILMAERITRLPQDKRQMVESLLLGMSINDKTDNE